MSPKNDCIFCKIIAKEIPAKFVYEDEDVVSFPDINPKARVHLLVVPKAHKEGLAVLEKEDSLMVGKLMVAVKKIAKKMNLDSFRVIINSGPGAGQTVFHLHLHLVSPDGTIA